MRFRLIILVLSLLAVLQVNAQKGNEKAPAQLESEGKLEGVVSSKYKNKGCGYLVQVKVAGKKMYFMPKTPLEKAFEKNGLRIKFNYRRLRLPSPPNCEFCYMVELKDLEKK